MKPRSLRVVYDHNIVFLWRLHSRHGDTFVGGLLEEFLLPHPGASPPFVEADIEECMSATGFNAYLADPYA